MGGAKAGRTLECNVSGYEKAFEKTKVDPADIAGIAIAQTATTIIFTDVDGRPLTDCVMWMDGRAEAQAEKINERLKEKRFSGKKCDLKAFVVSGKKAGYGHARTCDAGCLSISLSQDDG